MIIVLYTTINSPISTSNIHWSPTHPPGNNMALYYILPRLIICTHLDRTLHVYYILSISPYTFIYYRGAYPLQYSLDQSSQIQRRQDRQTVIKPCLKLQEKAAAMLGKIASVILLIACLPYCHYEQEVPWEQLPWHIIKMLFTVRGFGCGCIICLLFLLF